MPSKTQSVKQEKSTVFHSAVPKAERMKVGKELRKKCSRKSHAEWKLYPKRKNPVSSLIEADKKRISHLVPLRNARFVAIVT